MYGTASRQAAPHGFSYATFVCNTFCQHQGLLETAADETHDLGASHDTDLALLGR